MRGRYPPPAPFITSSDVGATTWIDDALQPFERFPGQMLVGEIVPSGFEAYARIFHPARRFYGRSIDQSVALRWSEIARARGKTVHPEMQIEALIDHLDVFDDTHWRAISSGGGKWFPPQETLEAPQSLALASRLRPFTETPSDLWLLLWDGYGDLGRDIDRLPRAMIHPDRSGRPLPPELAGRTPAFRHYLVFRGPPDGLATWFRWRDEAPNYWWPQDRSWVVVTEIDGFSSYVGGSQGCIAGVLSDPLLEALPSGLEHRLFGRDPVNGPATEGGS